MALARDAEIKTGIVFDALIYFAKNESKRNRTLHLVNVSVKISLQTRSSTRAFLNYKGRPARNGGRGNSPQPFPNFARPPHRFLGFYAIPFEIKTRSALMTQS